MEKQEAKELIIRYLNEEISSADKLCLVDWIKMSEENMAFYVEVKDAWEASFVNANQVARTHEEWEKLKSRIQQGSQQVYKRSIQVLRLWQTVAAVLVVLLAVSGWFAYQSNQQFELLGLREIKTIVPSGEKSQVVLPDGTIVWINSGSELVYTSAFGVKSRNIQLKGEAYFEVTKDDHLPFNVTTKDCQVTVLGTRFNVNAYDNSYTETALEEGSVSLLSNSGTEYLMEVGQVALAKNDGSIELKSSNVNNLVCWKDNVLRFDNSRLEDVVERLERWYGVNIHVHQMEQMKDRRFTFTVKTETLAEILQIFQMVNPISYEINGDKVTVRLDNN